MQSRYFHVESDGDGRDLILTGLQHSGTEQRTDIVKMCVITANTEVKVVLWSVTPCSFAVGYPHFGDPYCLHLQREVKMDVARFSKTSLSYRKTTLYNNPEDLELNLHRHDNIKSRHALQLWEHNTTCDTRGNSELSCM